MGIADIVKLLLALGVHLAEMAGHSNDDLKNEIERQLDRKAETEIAWEEYVKLLPVASDR